MTVPASIDAATLSTPADTSQCSFIGLPAEIRNQVYTVLFKFANPVHISVHPHPKAHKRCYRRDVTFSLSDTEIPSNVFLACRTMYHDATSIFYKNKVFVLDLESMFGIRSPKCPVEVLDAFFAAIGSQGSALRKLVLGIDFLWCARDHRVRHFWDHKYSDKMVFGKEYHAVEITPLLRVIWNNNITADVTIVHESDHGHRVAQLDMNLQRDMHLANAILRSLLYGPLNLKAHAWPCSLCSGNQIRLLRWDDRLEPRRSGYEAMGSFPIGPRSCSDLYCKR
ncbi:hypothetical protein CC86DRAFT_459824 [Ophiobolus disseminans]|uniref:F-box domain-containing protein n=1 Tax=Ophiobolus disseminans TaxID=1469910 RepID=A0A6A6ZJF5_9PLEO|nr:hypothetical protein CC86DRAFT_459824 [Ophiobolus disseminans]